MKVYKAICAEVLLYAAQLGIPFCIICLTWQIESQCYLRHLIEILFFFSVWVYAMCEVSNG